MPSADAAGLFVPSSSRTLRAVLIAGAVCLILATHVLVDFHGVRAKVVPEPIAVTTGATDIPVSADSVTGLRAPFAVIARIQHEEGTGETFEVAIDGSTVCRPFVRSGGARRVDCVMAAGWYPPGEHRVSVSSAAPRWMLEYLELATHHGSSGGIVSFVVLPATSRQYTRPAAGWIALAGAVLLALFLRPAPPPSRRRIWCVLYRILVGISLVWFGAVLASPLVSEFSVVLRLWPFLGWIGLLLAPRLWAESPMPVRFLGRTRSSWGWVAGVVLVSLLVLAAYGAVARARLEQYGGNYSGFIKIATRWFDGHPRLADRADIRDSLLLESDTYGYDAQYMYLATYDPFLTDFREDVAIYRRFIDTPPYRLGRIGFSLLTKVLSGNRWERYPATMVWLVLASLAISGAVLALIARARGGSIAWGAAIVLVPGFWASLEVSLPEPVSTAALLGGFLCVLGRRWVAAGLLLALSLLVRETGLFFVVCLVGWTFFSGRRKEAVTLAAVALGPFVAWRVYLGWVLLPDWGMDALFFRPENFGVPFGGIIDVWVAISRGEYWPELWEMTRAGLSFTVLIVAGFALALTLAIRAPGPVTLAAAGYAVLAVNYNLSEVWEAPPGAERLTSDLFVMLALASTGLRRLPRALRIGVAVFWMAAAAHVFLAVVHAEFYRNAFASLGTSWLR